MTEKPTQSPRSSTRSAPSRLVDPVDNPERLLGKVSGVVEPPQTLAEVAVNIHGTEKTITQTEMPTVDPELGEIRPVDPANQGRGRRKSDGQSLAEKLKEWMDTVVLKRVPDLVMDTMNEYVDTPDFSALIVNSLSRVAATWTENIETDSPLKTYIDTELTRKLTQHVTPKYVLVPRTDSLDQPQVVEESPSPYLPALPRGGGHPDDDPDKDPDKHGKGKRRRRRKKKKSKKGRHDSTDSDTDGHTSDSNSDSTSDGDSDDSDSDSHDEDKKSRKSKRKTNQTNLRVFVPLNDWFVKACNYKSYRLSNRSAKYSSSVAEKMPRYRKRLEPQMKTRTFSGQDPITILSFLHWFQKSCDQCGISEGAAVWCFQFFLTGQAYDQLHSRLAGGSKAVDIGQSELLHSYEEVVNFLLTTYVTNEVISEEYNRVMQFRQSTGQGEQDFADKLWQKAQRCGTVFSDRRLKSLFADNLQTSLRRSVNNYLSTKVAEGTILSYQELDRHAQGLGDQLRGSSRRTCSVDFSRRAGRIPRPQNPMR